MFIDEKLIEKWQPVLDVDNAPKLKTKYDKYVVAQLLENQTKAMDESTTTSALSAYDPVLVKMVRRAVPRLVANELCGVQPMSLPTGIVFSLTSNYGSNTGPVALFNEADTTFGGTGTQAGTGPVAGANPWAAYTTGTAEPTATGEGAAAFPQMSLNINKSTVTAQTRQLGASASLELIQDMKSVHNLDALEELTNILSTEIQFEVDRELMRTIYSTATLGATNTILPGTFNMLTDANGRWSGESVRGLVLQINKEANAIAIATRRGRGNKLIASSDVVAMLATFGMMDYSQTFDKNVTVETNDFDGNGIQKVGKLGSIEVFVDPYLTGACFTIGYKNPSLSYDAGLYYCPYVPAQLYNAINPSTFQPAIGVKTRYGMVPNPFAIVGGKNCYFRNVMVTGV